MNSCRLSCLLSDGMMCSMCEAHINDLVRKTFPNASKVKSSHRKGECSFLTEDDIDEKEINEALNNMGYKLLAVKSENCEKRKNFG